MTIKDKVWVIIVTKENVFGHKVTKKQFSTLTLKNTKINWDI